MADAFLLYPEWQGSGRSPAVHEGAFAIARELFPRTLFQTIESPAAEMLQRTDDVVGLRSIGPRFREAITALRANAPDRVITIGGTCGVEAAPVGYLNERYEGDLAVVWLDAHGDLNTPASSPSGNFHGMVLRTLLGEGPDIYVRELRRPLQPRQIFLAATRDLDPPERDFIASRGISLTIPDALSDPATLANAIRARDLTRVYLHLDLDALDPSDFSGMLIPTPGGPSLAAVQSAISTLATDFAIVGFSIVEFVRGDERSLQTLRDLAAASGIC